MKEREEINRGKINLSVIKYYGIPTERLINIAAKISEDPHTTEGLNKAKEVLSEKGLIILDVHHSRFDVAATGFNLLKELKVDRVVLPGSIKHLNDPIVKDFYNDLNKIEGFDIFPTYRMADYVEENEKKLYENMSEEERTNNNYAYINKAVEVLKEPHSIVFVAAYGGMNQPGANIPTGVEKILKTGNPALCSLSVYNKLFIPIKTYTSEKLLYFDENSNRINMYKAVLDEHRNIAVRVGFDPGYFDYDKALLRANNYKVNN